jgi:hypothetical protein
VQEAVFLAPFLQKLFAKKNTRMRHVIHKEIDIVEHDGHSTEGPLQYFELEHMLHFAIQEINLLKEQYRVLELQYQETNLENQNLKKDLEQFGKQHESLKMRMRDMHNQLAHRLHNSF